MSDWQIPSEFFPHHSIVEDKKISGDKQSGSDMLGPKIGDRCPHFWHLHNTNRYTGVIQAYEYARSQINVYSMYISNAKKYIILYI
jgi:hypothetical protein